MNCGFCSAGLLPEESLGRCLDCSALLCESCHGDFCAPCGKRVAAQFVADLGALTPKITLTVSPLEVALIDAEVVRG